MTGEHPDPDRDAAGGASDGDESVVDAVEVGAPSGDRSVAGLLLAAGTSSRFGSANKLLTSIDGETVVHHAAATLVAAELDPVIVVVGHDADQVEAAVADLPVTTVQNPDYAAGQSTSLEAGIRALPDDVDGVVVALGDMPDVAPDTVRSLVAAFENGAGTALAAGYEGRRGNPVLFARQHFDALRSVAGDAGGRSVLLDADEMAIVETGDPGVRRDVDVPSDLSG